MQFLDEQIGVLKLTHEFPSFFIQPPQNLAQHSRMVNANVLDFRYVISNFNTGNAQYNWVKVTDINSYQVKTKAQCGLEQEGLLSPTERASVSVISLRPLGQSR